MNSEMRLHDPKGRRLYLTAGERRAFLKAAEKAERTTRTLCMTLTFTGCRLSEALALTVEHVDLEARTLTFESLKKRRRGVWRPVPVPEELLEALDLVHGIRELQGRRKAQDVRLWPIHRATAWRHVHAVLEDTGIQGPHATPKGLRHGFGVAAITSGVPLNLLQRWLGHAQLSTTSIYAQAVGEEERDIVARMWRKE